MAVEPINYKPLEVIPIDKPSCPRFCKVAKIATFALTGLSIGVSVGVACAFSLAWSAPLVGTIAAVVGFVAGVILGFLDKELDPLVKYRLATLNQFEATQTDNTILGCLKDLKKVFNQAVPQFVQNYELHTLHDRLTRISEAMKNEKRPDIKKVWQVFLENTKNLNAKMPDGSLHVVDCTFEKERLAGKKIDYQIQRLSAPSDADLDQIVGLEAECFGRIGTFNKNQLRFELAKPLAFLYVARRKDSSEILGFNWGHANEKNPQVRQIYGIGRKASGARLRIGERLMDQLVQDSAGRALGLQVRSTNASAIQLYKSRGFLLEQTLKSHYSDPVEDALVMHRPIVTQVANTA